MQSRAPCRLSQSSMHTHEVLLCRKDLLCTFYEDLEKRKTEHQMEVPFLEIWWFFLQWAMEIPADLMVYLAWPCRFMSACGDIKTEVDAAAVLAIGEDIVKSKKALCPIAMQGHWVLLIVDLVEKKLKYVDTLNKIKPEIVVKMDAVLKIFQSIDGLEWLPADIRPCRVNMCRQGRPTPPHPPLPAPKQCYSTMLGAVLNRF